MKWSFPTDKITRRDLWHPSERWHDTRWPSVNNEWMIYSLQSRLRHRISTERKCDRPSICHVKCPDCAHHCWPIIFGFLVLTFTKIKKESFWRFCHIKMYVESVFDSLITFYWVFDVLKLSLSLSFFVFLLHFTPQQRATVRFLLRIPWKFQYLVFANWPPSMVSTRSSRSIVVQFQPISTFFQDLFWTNYVSKSNIDRAHWLTLNATLLAIADHRGRKLTLLMSWCQMVYFRIDHHHF